MKKSLYIFLIVIASIAQQAVAQNPKIDSLLALIKSDKEDTNKVMHLKSLCWEYIELSEYEMGLTKAKQALELAKKLDYTYGMAFLCISIGDIYDGQGNYPEALKSFFNSLKLFQEMDIKYPNKRNNQKDIAGTYNNISLVYRRQGNYNESLKNQLAALKIRKEINDKMGIAASYNNLGLIYEKQGSYDKATESYAASLKIGEEINDNYLIAASYGNLGNVYYNQKNYNKAIEMNITSLKLYEKIGSKVDAAICFINIGQLYTDLHKPKEAQDYLNKAFQQTAEIGSKELKKETCASQVLLDSMLGNYKAAFEHHKLYILYRDSLNNEETKKKSLQSAMQYEFDKREIAAKAEQDKLDAINAEEKKKQRIVIYAVAGLLVLVGVFAVFMFNRFRITNRQKVIIEKQKVLVDNAYETLHEKNKEVMDSIRYAKRIQTALITSEKTIANMLNRLMKN